MAEKITNIKSQPKPSLKSKGTETPGPAQPTSGIVTSTVVVNPVQGVKPVIELVKSTAPSKMGNSKAIVYNIPGLRGSVRISSTLFEGGTAKAPATITNLDQLNGQPKVAKKKLTKEERAALPKPTAAQKLAEAKERHDRAAKRLEKLQAELNAAPAM
jgi:hypothetical protein